MGKHMIELTPAKLKDRFIKWVNGTGHNNTTEDLLNLAIEAVNRTGVALESANFLQNQNSESYAKLMNAWLHLKKIADYLEKGLKYKENAEAVLLIYESLKILRQDNLIQNDPVTAAKSFDQLFIGFGTLAKNFPPPFDQTVGEFLLQCGTLSFFSNMQNTMAGPNSNLGQAVYLRNNMNRN